LRDFLLWLFSHRFLAIARWDVHFLRFRIWNALTRQKARIHRESSCPADFHTTILKVLHVVENLDRGAVENWLLRMLEHARNRGVPVDWTFYCILQQSGESESRAEASGARVIHSPVPLARKAEFIRAFRQALRHDGYEILHCHHDLLSAVYLMASVAIPFRRRIVHVHNADECVPTASRIKQDVLREPMRQTCLRMADRIVGISNHTLDTFLAGRARLPKRDSVLYYGVNPAPFANSPADRAGLRRQLHFAEDARILLFAGRMVPEKNPVFALEVLEKLRLIEPRAVGLFAGSGSVEHHVLDRARELGLEKSVRLLGWRNDLPEIMCCCDWFILPHPEYPVEGFGLAVVEAQLAGLRLLLSPGIADDPLLPTASFRRVALAAGLEIWAQAAMEMLQMPASSRNAAIAALKESPMDMDRALRGLLQLHA
jgi:glycosyltransferase involved in cell wall biosynthesis